MLVIDIHSNQKYHTYIIQTFSTVQHIYKHNFVMEVKRNLEFAICKAIRHLKSATGSSLGSIISFLQAKNGTEEIAPKDIKLALRSAQKQGKLVVNQGKYCLNVETDACKPRKSRKRSLCKSRKRRSHRSRSRRRGRCGKKRSKRRRSKRRSRGCSKRKSGRGRSTRRRSRKTRTSGKKRGCRKSCTPMWKPRRRRGRKCGDEPAEKEHYSPTSTIETKISNYPKIKTEKS